MPPVRATVRVWHDEEGWGVLDSPETPGGCWTHYSALDMAGYHAAAAGQGAELTAEAGQQDGYAWRAVRVVLDGVAPGPIVRPITGSSAYRSTLTIEWDELPAPGDA